MKRTLFVCFDMVSGKISIKFSPTSAVARILKGVQMQTDTIPSGHAPDSN